MPKISLDLMGETYRETEVTCFTIPGPGVCISIKTDRSEVEVDLPEELFGKLKESIAGIKKE